MWDGETIEELNLWYGNIESLKKDVVWTKYGIEILLIMELLMLLLLWNFVQPDLDKTTGQNLEMTK